MNKEATRILRKGEHRRAFAAVEAVIREWDPYELPSSGCPEGELDREIASVVAQIPRIRSERDARDAISRVFSSAFGDRVRFGPERCSEVGTRLFRALDAEGLLEGSRRRRGDPGREPHQRID
jgi:hypothetical protein